MPEATRALGRYELVELLGQGGMGEVYLAKISGAAGFEKPCIVKTILPSLLSDPQFLDRFHHEAKVLVHLVHSNIAQVYDMGESASTYFMALEYVAGVDLSHVEDQARAQGQPLPLPVALYIGQKMAEGLGYAHRKTGPEGMPLNIVHRDVSPQNVMVSYEGEVKVIDFGLAKSAARSKHTLTPTVMGKLGYMSPEQARAEAVDHRSDIYSAGVVVWEMLAGRPLFASGTMGEMIAAMMSPKVPSLATLRGDIDPGLEAALMRALAPKPADRFARADDFARALGEHLFKTGTHIGAEEVGTFVRTLCPEAFATQRRLISKLSSVRGKTPVEPLMSARTPSRSVADAEMGYGATTVRSGPKEPPSGAPPPGASQVIPGQHGSRALLVALVVLALVATAAVTGWFVTRRDDAKEIADLAAVRVSPAAPAVPTPIPTPPSPPPPMVTPAPSPVATATPVAAAEPEKPAEPAHHEPAHEPARPKHRALPAGELVPVKATAELFLDHGAHYARGGSANGLAVGSEYDVVGPGNGPKRRRIGTATVMEVFPHLARVSLDDAAQEAGGRKYVALADEKPAAAPVAEPTPPPAQVTPPPEAPKPAPKPLQGRASISGLGPLRDLTVYNADTRVWHECTVVIRGRRRYSLDSLAPGGNRELPIRDFTYDGSLPATGASGVNLYCKEATGTFAVLY